MKRRHPSVSAAPHRSRGGFFIRLGVITFAGWLLRILVAWELGSVNGGYNSVFTPSSASDLCTYMRLGREIASGIFPPEFYYQPFYYAVFLPLLNLLSGSSVIFVIVVQSLLGAATVWLCGLSGAIFGGRKAGLYAALLGAISTPLLLYTPFHQNETLQTFNLALLFYLTLRAVALPTLWRWGGAGIVCGIAIATRGNIWLLTPLPLLLLVMVAHQKRISWRRCGAAMGLFMLGVILVQLPFSLYNTRARGELSGPSTAAGAVLTLGNTPEAPPCGRDPGLPAGPMEYPESFHRMMARAEAGTSVAAQMWEWFTTEPAAFLELQFRKLLFFWDHREVPNNVSLYGEGRASVVLSYLLPGRSAVVVSLGLAGMLLLLGRLFRRHDCRVVLLFGFIVLYWGAVAVFYNLSRFRAPIIPELAIAGGFFIATLLRRCRRAPAERRPLVLAGCGAALLGGVWISVSACDFYRDNLEAAVMRLVRPDGTEIRLGNPETQVFDHGPQTFGGWRDRPLFPGAVIGKRFCNVPDEFELEWKIFSPAGGDLVFSVNGRRELVRLEPGENNLRFSVNAPEGELSLRIISVAEGVTAIIDRQRDYRRSTLDGAPIGGEWIMRACFHGD